MQQVNRAAAHWQLAVSRAESGASRLIARANRPYILHFHTAQTPADPLALAAALSYRVQLFQGPALFAFCVCLQTGLLLMAAGGLVPGEALYRAAEQLGSSTRPMYTQLLLPISQLEEGIGFLVRLCSREEHPRGEGIFHIRWP